jgi:gluconate 2-dehydrogenase gamma chain
VGKYYCLTISEANILDALADQIIPPDDFEGGKQAGVTNFIDIQLSGFYSKYREMYRSCLASLNQKCLEVYGKGFTGLRSAEQFEYLTEIEAGGFDHEQWAEGYSPSKFFRTVITHCMQGYYGSPIHGGNKDYVSYRLIGLDYPLIKGRNVY